MRETAMKYFHPSTIFLAKHAQHIVVVHFPIALLVTSVLFDLLARWTGRGTLASAAVWNLYGAAVTAPVAAITGVLAWRLLLEGARLKGALLLHLCAGVIVLLLIGGMAWFRLRRGEAGERPLSVGYFVVGVLAVVAVAVAGHLGGVVSGVVTIGG